MLRVFAALVVLLALAGTTVAWATTRTLDATAALKTTKRDGLRATQKGTVDAKPFGKGTLTLNSFIQKGKIDATFTATIGSSQVRGRAFGRVDIKKRITFTGTARLTSGTGRFKNVSGRGLRFTGNGPLNGRTIDVTLRGAIKY